MLFPVPISFSQGSVALKGNWVPNHLGSTQVYLFFIKEHKILLEYFLKKPGGYTVLKGTGKEKRK